MRPLAAALLLTLAAYAANQAALGPPRSTGLPFGASDLSPEPANSLPPGFTTNHPITPSTGVLGRVRVP